MVNEDLGVDGSGGYGCRIDKIQYGYINGEFCSYILLAEQERLLQHGTRRREPSRMIPRTDKRGIRVWSLGRACVSNAMSMPVIGARLRSGHVLDRWLSGAPLRLVQVIREGCHHRCRLRPLVHMVNRVGTKTSPSTWSLCGQQAGFRPAEVDGVAVATWYV